MRPRQLGLWYFLAAVMAASALQVEISANQEQESCRGGEVCTRSFTGPNSNKNIVFNIYLPPDYQDTGQRYPVIYHLHGAGGDHTSGNDFVIEGLEQAVAAEIVPPTILVFPNGYGNSMWADSRDGSRPAERSFVRELISYIDGTYRTRSSPNFRIIQGSSMGGYGAAAISAKYPELFSVCVIYDGALHDWKSLSERREKIALEMFDNDEGYYDRFSPWKNARLNAGRIRDRIDYRIVVGSLVEFNQAYRLHLERLGLSVDYIETGCDHSLGCVMEATNLQNFEFIATHSGLSAR